MNPKISRLLTIALGLGLGVWVFYRAANLSFTHDESGSYIFFYNQPYSDLLFDVNCWISANNHILNSALFKLSVDLFGISDLNIRLPNALAFIGCFIVAFSISEKHLSKTLPKLILFVVLFINPYVMDFYSLCRGYGLSMFFHLSTLYFLLNYLKNGKTRNLHFSFIALLLASLSLLTNAILFPVYGLALWIVKRKQLTSNVALLYTPILWGLITLGFLWIPIKFLKLQNEFQFGVKSIWDSFKSFAQVSLANQDYGFSLNTTADIVTVILVSCIIFALVAAFRSTTTTRIFAIAFLLLLVLLHLVFMADFLFPSERKTTLYVPLIACLLSFASNKINIPNWRIWLSRALICLVSLHFAIQLNPNQTIEWKYDRKTKDYIFALRDMKKKINLQAYWVFHPTSTYYILTQEIENINIIPYDKELKLSPEADAIIHFEWDFKNDPALNLYQRDQELALSIRK